MVKMKIIYFAPIAYDELKQRSQYISEYLANKHQVIYVEPTLRWISHLKNRQLDYSKKDEHITDTLSVFRCNGLLALPFHWNLFDVCGLNGLYEAFQLRLIVRNADVVIVGFEGWYQVLRWLDISCLVYDKMDDNSLLVKNFLDQKYLLKAEKKLLKKVDEIIVTAQAFYERYQSLGKPVTLIPNGVELPDLIITEESHEKKIYGYVGMISAWIDMQVIEQIADEPQTEVWLVGPCNIAVSKKKNIKYFGRIPKSEVAKYINQFDVCLYPFKMDQLVDTVNPVKIYEYLAMNKPVIAIDSIETQKFGELLYRYSTREEVRLLCQQRLEKPFESDVERVEFIRNNSWEERGIRVQRVVEQRI